MTHPAIFIDTIINKGRGVFTSEAIPENTTIEIAPVIVMERKDRDVLDKTLLHDYIFEWNPENADQCCMALGYVPIYNHSYESNCEYFMDYDKQTMSVITMRDIEVGEELTINYNGDWDNKQPVWFDVV